MVIVGGDRGDLSVSHRDLGIKRGEFQMLLVFLRAVVAAREREDQRIVALKLAELAQFARVIGQFVVGENASWHNIRTHDSTPPMSPWGYLCLQTGHSCSAAMNQAYAEPSNSDAVNLANAV